MVALRKGAGWSIRSIGSDVCRGVGCAPFATDDTQALVDAVEAVGFGASPLQPTQTHIASPAERGFQAIDLASPSPPPPPPHAPVAATTTSTLRPPDAALAVEGMMCQKNCGATVQRALGAVPGVAAAAVSFEEGKARVWWLRGEAAVPPPTVQVGFSQSWVGLLNMEGGIF